MPFTDRKGSSKTFPWRFLDWPARGGAPHGQIPFSPPAGQTPPALPLNRGSLDVQTECPIPVPSLAPAAPRERGTPPALTLPVLAVLVAGHGVHAVAGGAVGGGTVGLRGREALHGLDGVAALAAAGRDGVGAVQAAVQGRDREIGLGLRRDPAGVAQDAHHLQRQRRHRQGPGGLEKGHKNGAWDGQSPNGAGWGGEPSSAHTNPGGSPGAPLGTLSGGNGAVPPRPARVWGIFCCPAKDEHRKPGEKSRFSQSPVLGKSGLQRSPSKADQTLAGFDAASGAEVSEFSLAPNVKG